MDPYITTQKLAWLLLVVQSRKLNVLVTVTEWYRTKRPMHFGHFLKKCPQWKDKIKMFILKT
jgi:hypothetical protein